MKNVFFGKQSFEKSIVYKNGEYSTSIVQFFCPLQEEIMFIDTLDPFIFW